ncbi:MAG: efflux RND transporter permease subunit [bacterium]
MSQNYFTVNLGGEYAEQQKSFREMIFVLFLAITLVYMVMTAQFESLLDPFIVLFSVPLALIGVIVTLLITSTTFNVQAFIGSIMLTGIVVNNAILLVDYTNILRREQGYHLYEAIITAGKRKLRPILMTTLTTVLGLLPLAIGIGEGSEMQVPLARTVCGGLLSSTFITLILIPVLYAVFECRVKMKPPVKA